MTQIRRGGQLHISPGLFLESQELNRLKQFLQDRGFKRQILFNSYDFGLVRFKGNNFPSTFNYPNGRVEASTNMTGRVIINPIAAIDSLGNFISSPDVDNLSEIVPGQRHTLEVPNDNSWYWVKVSYDSYTGEAGTFSIDANGNLSGTNGRLLEVLRGMPNTESVITFKNSTNNTLEYRVVSVIDNNNAVLQGNFTPENDLKISVVGSFTPGMIPNPQDKGIFRYDSAKIEFVPEQNNNEAPPKQEGLEFYLARVKRDGSTIDVQDKRSEFWQTRADSVLSDIDESLNPCIGIERIRFGNYIGRRTSNIVEFSHGFRVTTWSVNSTQGVTAINISSGLGGRYKDESNINTGDFAGWLLYIPSKNEAYNVIGAVNQGSPYILLEKINIDDFSDDGGITFTGEELFIAPKCEEIEIRLTPQNGDRDSIDSITKTFPNFTPLCKIEVPQINPHSTTIYTIEYRYKQFQTFNEFILFPDNQSFGYYTEKAFGLDGEMRPIVTSNSYAQNIAQGYIKTFSEEFELERPSNFFTELGDLKGQESVDIQNGGVTNFIVGDNTMIQNITDSDPIDSEVFLNLQDPSLLRDGTSFCFRIFTGIDKATGVNVQPFRICHSYDNGNYINVYTFSERDLFTLGVLNSSNNTEYLEITVTVNQGQWIPSVKELGTKTVDFSSGIGSIGDVNDLSISAIADSEGKMIISGKFVWDGDSNPTSANGILFYVQAGIASNSFYSSVHALPKNNSDITLLAVPEDANSLPPLRIKATQFQGGGRTDFDVENPQSLTKGMTYYFTWVYQRNWIFRGIIF